jgi:hypothetical protein
MDNLGGSASHCVVGRQRVCVGYWTVDALGSQFVRHWSWSSEFRNWVVEYRGHLVWMGQAFRSASYGGHSVGQDPPFRHD